MERHMSTSVQIVEAEAMKLTPSERADLADKLWLSVHSQDDVDAAWEAEIAHRIEELEAGRTESVPYEQVRAELLAMIEAHRAR